MDGYMKGSQSHDDHTAPGMDITPGMTLKEDYQAIVWIPSSLVTSYRQK
jgi:hypothetical protein